MLNQWENAFVEDGVRVIQRLDFLRTIITFEGLKEILARGLRLGVCGGLVNVAEQ
jgi:hypothetical protein